MMNVIEDREMWRLNLVTAVSEMLSQQPITKKRAMKKEKAK